MAEISLNRNECERVLANEESEPGSRLVAAFAIAFFEANESAEDAGRESLHVAQQLLHMTQRAIYDAQGLRMEPTDGG